MAFTRSDLIDSIDSEKVGVSLTARDKKNIVVEMLDIITQNLADNESVTLSGLGTFNLKETPPRFCRNPKTGEQVEVSAKRKVTFKPSKTLKEAVQTFYENSDNYPTEKPVKSAKKKKKEKK